MATILITGGTGFVGTQIRQKLSSHHVRLLSRSGSPDVMSSTEDLVSGDVFQPGVA